MEVRASQQPTSEQVQIQHQQKNLNELTTQGKTHPVGGYVVHGWAHHERTLQRANKNQAWCGPGVVVTNNQAPIPGGREAPLARPPTV